MKVFKGFSTRMTIVAIVIGFVFLVTIIAYPLMFSPSNLDKATAPAPVAPQ